MLSLTMLLLYDCEGVRLSFSKWSRKDVKGFSFLSSVLADGVLHVPLDSNRKGSLSGGAI